MKKTKMDIMEKLCDDLRREVLSYVPTKTIKITDEFVEWSVENGQLGKKFLF